MKTGSRRVLRLGGVGIKLWYVICNVHGTILRTEKRVQAEEKSMVHSACNDKCRTGLFEIAEKDREQVEITRDVNQCFNRLIARSTGGGKDKL